MTIRRWLPLLVPAFAASCFGINLCGPPGPPPPDSCTGDSSSGVDTVEVGPDSDGFVPFTDGQVVNFITGGQGSFMLPVRIRVGGASPPACLSQHTTLTNDKGDEMGRDKDPRATYPDGSFRTTRTIYLVLFGYAEPGHALTLTVTVGQKSVTRTIYYGQKPSGGSDAATADDQGGWPSFDGSAPVDARLAPADARPAFDAGPSLDAAFDQAPRDR